MAVPFSATRAATRAASRLPTLRPEEEEGLLRRSGHALLSGLGYAGETLTKPSRALWGTLSGLTGGDWGGGLLNLVPFSDTLGLTDPRQGVELSGFLEQKGVIPRNRPGFDAWDIPRLGLDIGGDPLSFTTGLGFGKALGKGGQALQRAGVLEDLVKSSGKGAREFLSTTTARQALQGLDRTQLRAVRDAAQGLGYRGLKDLTQKASGPLGGQLGLNLPFRAPIKTFGSPGVGRALDTASDALRWNPVSREAHRLFNPAVKGGRARAEQEFGKFLTKTERAAERGVDRFTLRLVDEIRRVSPELLEPEGQRYLRSMVEGVVDHFPPEYAERLSQPASDIGEMLGRFLREARDAGGKVGELQDVLKFFPRQIRGKSRDRMARELVDPRKGLSAFTGHALSRRDYLRDIETGTSALDDLFRDPQLKAMIEAGHGKEDIANWMRENWGDIIPEQYIVRNAKGEPILQTSERTLDDLIEKHTDELLEEKRAEIDFTRQAAEQDVEFRRRHSDLVKKAKGDVDPDSIHPRFDEVVEEYQNATGRFDATEDDVMEVLRSKNPTKPRLTRADVEQEARALAADEFGRMTVEEGAPVMGDRFEKLASLARRSYDSAPERFTEGLFEDPLDSLYRYMQGMARVTTTGRSMSEFLGNQRFMQEATRLKAGEKGIPLHQLMRQMGLNSDTVIKNAIGEGASDKAIAAFKWQKVSESTAQRLLKMGGFGQKPEDMALVEKLWNWQNNLFKASVTAPWTAFHGRNWLGGQVQNIITGLLRPGRAIAENRNAHRLLTGQVVPDAHEIPFIRRILQEEGQELTAENGTEALRRLLAEKRVWSAHETIGMGTDIVGAGADPTSLQRLESRMPGGLGGQTPLFKPGVTDPLKEIGGRYIGLGPHATLNPLRAQMRGGITGAQHSTFGPFAAGELAGTWIEGQNRIPAFIDQLRRGVDPDVAAKNIADAQVSYAARDFTAAERRIKQVVPFYSYGARMAKFVTGELLNRPGGPMAQIIKQQSRVGRDDENIPPYLRGSLSVPLGEGELGGKRYLTGLGLMHEGSFLNIPTAVGGAPSFKETGAQLLASTAPAIKGPIETVTGQSLYQRGPLGGRPLESMDVPIGGTIENIRQLAGGERRYPAPPFLGSRGLEAVVANSPLSRVFTTARTFTDVRKLGPELAAEILTGLRITDISPQQQERILRDRLAAAMQEAGAAKFSTIRFTSQQISQASEEEARQMMLFNALANRIEKEQAAARRRRSEEQPDRSIRFRPVSVTQ